MGLNKGERRGFDFLRRLCYNLREMRHKGDISVKELIRHYDLLIDENNDPVRDSPLLREYMDKWDGEAFIQRMRLDKSKSVLEIGVGTGRLAVRVAPLCRSFFGIDISPKTVERARVNLLEYSNVKLACADFWVYTFSERFDVIYSSLTFMHIKEKQVAIDKAAALLNDGGRFVLSVDKSRNEYIDMGSRRLKIYPDSAEAIRSNILISGMTVREEYETELAHIFVCVKAG